MTHSRRAELAGSHRRAWTTELAILAFSAVAVLATACGGGGSSGTGGSANAVAHLGTTTTTSTGTSNGTSNGTSGAGAAAGAGASASGASNPEQLGADLMKFSACMRSHGVPNFPNPVISNNGVSLHISVAVSGAGTGSKASPQFRQAAQDCRKVRAGRPHEPKHHYGAAGGLPEGGPMHAGTRHKRVPGPGLLGRRGAVPAASGDEPEYLAVRGGAACMSKLDPERPPLQLDRRKPMRRRSFIRRSATQCRCGPKNGGAADSPPNRLIPSTTEGHRAVTGAVTVL